MTVSIFLRAVIFWNVEAARMIPWITLGVFHKITVSGYGNCSNCLYWELNFLVLMGPFHLEMFCDSMDFLASLSKTINQLTGEYNQRDYKTLNQALFSRFIKQLYTWGLALSETEMSVGRLILKGSYVLCKFCTFSARYHIRVVPHREEPPPFYVQFVRTMSFLRWANGCPVVFLELNQ